MSPQFVDYDGDGLTDIVTGTYDGSAHVALGTEQGFAAPTHILDASGKRVMLEQYWCYDSEEWKELGKNHCVAATVFDWDDDGDFDLLLGAYGGGLFLQMNKGAPGEPAFTGSFDAVQAGGEPLVVGGGLTATRLVDWDADGLVDLVCGGFKGGVYLYRNTGEAGQPSFAAAETLIPKTTNDPEGPLAPTSGCYADPVDYDGDGDLDLLVGGYANWTPSSRKLTEAEEARLAEVEQLVEETQAEMSKAYEEVQARIEGLDKDVARAEIQKVFASEEMQALQKESRALMEELEELRPGEKRKSGVWLYERVTGAASQEP